MASRKWKRQTRDKIDKLIKELREREHELSSKEEATSKEAVDELKKAKKALRKSNLTDYQRHLIVARWLIDDIYDVR